MNEYFALYVSEQDQDALRDVSHSLLQRHTSLKQNSSPPDFRVVNCTSKNTSAVNDLVHMLCHLPFNTQEFAFLRVCIFHSLPASLLRTLPPGTKNILIFAAPAAVVDKWSLSILLDDASVLYQAGQRKTSGLGPAWTRGEIEAPAGEKNMGTYTMAIYTTEQQNRLQIDETGQQKVEYITHELLSPVECDYALYLKYKNQSEIAKQRNNKIWSFWQRVLSEPLPVMHLPTDRPRPPSRTLMTSILPFQLSQEQCQTLQDFSGSNEQHYSMRTILCTVFHSLLYRYTSQTDLLLGITMQCRNESEIRDTVGKFENIVPIRGDFTGNPTMEMMLKRHQSLIQAAEANAGLSLEDLLKRRKLGLTKQQNQERQHDTSRHPLLDVNFHFESPTTNDRNLPSDIACLLIGLSCDPFNVRGMRMQPLEVERSEGEFDIQLSVAHSNNQVRAVFQYNTALFDRSTIERMAEHFQTLLASAVNHPKQKISELQMITVPEQRLTTQDWNTTHCPFDLSKCIHQLIEIQVTKTPNAPAIVSDNGTIITYTQLNQKANQLAHHLRYLGIGPDLPVPIFLTRSASVVISLLAVLKSGGTCMPLDPKYPKDRMMYMLKQANATVIITERTLRSRVPNEYMQATASTVIVLEDEVATLSQCSIENPIHINRSSRDLAYVIYTSGSTGQPKGVMLEHRSIVNYMSWHVEYYEMKAGDRVLHNAGLAFDASMAETWPTLFIGGTIYPLIDTEIRLDPHRLLQWMGDTQITLAFLTTQLCEAILEEEYPSNLCLRYLYTGGDKLHRGPTKGATFTLVNIYGPTENTINTTMCHVRAGLKTPPPIGSPVPNTQVYVLDQTLKPCPIGVFGELYLAGVQLARGYFCRDDLTKERFVPNPFYSIEQEEQEQERGREQKQDTLSTSTVMYKTGDLVRWLPNGEIEFFGRIDTQVKIRGFRIELGEIEAALYTRTDCREVCVVAREDNPGDKRLVAYVVSSNATPSSSELRSFLSEKLPPFMIPSSFVFLDSMPLTPNDKIDRRALPAPTFNETSSVKFVAPRNVVEEQLVEIWKSVLPVSDISIHSTFMELGGHSLLAARLMSRVRSRFRIQCPLSRLFESPTVAGLAETIQAALQIGGEINITDINTPSSLFPVQQHVATAMLSYNERSLWYLNQVKGIDDWSSLAYNIPWAAKVQSRTGLPIDWDQIEASLLELLNRHASLRTGYIHSLDNEEPTTIIRTAESLKLTHVDAENWTDAKLKEHMLDSSYVPFDLQKGPLLRASLYLRGVDEHFLLITVHHIAVDLWSYVVLMQELAAMCNNHKNRNEKNTVINNNPSSSSSSSSSSSLHSYRMHVGAQMKELVGPQGDVLWAYWQSQLSSPLPVLHLPTDRPRPPSMTYEGSAHIISIPNNIANAARSFCAASSVTVYAFLLTAFQSFLCRYTGQDDIIVGTPTACRTDDVFEKTVGYFVNPVAIRTDITGDPTFNALVERTSSSIISAMDHQAMPFSLLVERLQPNRDASRSPIFDVMFVLQRSHDTDGIDPRYFMGVDGVKFSLGDDLECESIGLVQRHAQFDLTLMMSENKDGFTAAFQYNTALFDRSTIERMAEHFQTLLASAVNHPKQKISELQMITVPEQRLTTQDWNTTHCPFDLSKCIHQLIEIQVTKTPNAPAIVSDNGTIITYTQLNQKANQLAHHLRYLGIGPDLPVPIFLTRSASVVISLLAVLKSGGTCMPLDPKYPKDRMMYMLKQANATVIITERTLRSRVPNEYMQATASTVIVLEDEVATLSQCSIENPIHINRSSRDLAYVIYTSGSTGQPKGVMLEHRSIVNYMSWHVEYYEMKAGDRVLHNAGLAFDASMAETWPTLFIGGTIYPLIDTEIRLDPHRLLQWMGDTQITLAFLTTQLCEAILEEEYPSNLCLRYLYTGGDKLHRGPTKGATFTLVNIYGPTENTINTTMCHVRAGLKTPPPIGSPVPNTQVYVLDQTLKPCPIGVFGELYLAGVQLARGYFCRDDLTKERFVPNPFYSIEQEEQEQERGREQKQDTLSTSTVMYKTGDLVRWLPNGEIEFFGRIDTQVKIRGFRIELGEIEAALYTRTDCREVCVVAREDNPGDKRLVAYVVSSNATPSSSELRSFLSEKLPPFMIPSSFVFLDSMPLTPNDKIDRRALPAPTFNETSSVKFVAPRNVVEEQLVEIWKSVLKRAHISVVDSFFDLGGHSLLAARLMGKIRKKLNVGISISKLFESPTIAGLSKLISAQSLAINASSNNTQSSSYVNNDALRGCSASSVVVGSLLRSASLGRSVRHLQQEHKRGRIGSIDNILSPSSVSASVRDTNLTAWIQKNESRTLRSPSAYGSLRTASAQQTKFSSSVLRRQRSAELPSLNVTKNNQKTKQQETKQATIDLPNDCYILSYNQRSLWFLHKVQPNRIDYIVHHVSQIASTFDLERLRNCFTVVANHHKSLITTYSEMDGIPFQCDNKQVRSDFFTVVDSSCWTQEQLHGAIEKQLHTPFDLLHGPVFKVHLYKNSSGHACMLITAHHIAMDGISLDIVLRDLGLCYQHDRTFPIVLQQTNKQTKLALMLTSFYNDKNNEMGEFPSTSMYEFSSRQAQYLSSTEGERLWKFWQRELSGHTPTLNLQTDFKRPPIQDTTGDILNVSFQQDQVIKLKQFAKNENVTIYTVLLTVFSCLLHKYSGQDDILIGSPMTGRTLDDTCNVDEVVGNFANPVVLRSTMINGTTFRKQVKKTFGKVMNALEYQAYPFALLVERLANFRDTSRSPLFQVLFSLNQAFLGQEEGASTGDQIHLGGSSDSGGILLNPMNNIQQSVSPFDLQLIITESGGTQSGTQGGKDQTNMTAMFQFATSLFKQSTIQRMSTHFFKLLDTILENPNRVLDDITMLNEIETDMLAIQWNATDRPFDSDICIHSLFEKQVEDTPHAVALTFGNFYQLSYDEVNSRANTFAWVKF